MIGIAAGRAILRPLGHPYPVIYSRNAHRVPSAKKLRREKKRQEKAARQPEPPPSDRLRFSGSPSSSCLVIQSLLDRGQAKWENVQSRWAGAVTVSFVAFMAAETVGFFMKDEPTQEPSPKSGEPWFTKAKMQTLQSAALLVMAPALAYSVIRGPFHARHIYRAVLALPGPGVPTAQVDLYTASISRPVVTMPILGSTLECIEVFGSDYSTYEYTIRGRALDGRDYRYRFTFRDYEVVTAVVNGRETSAGDVGSLLISGWSKYGGEVTFAGWERSWVDRMKKWAFRESD